MKLLKAKKGESGKEDENELENETTSFYSPKNQ